MIVTIESKKPLNELNAEVWDNIFVDSVEKVEDIKNVNTIRINGVTCVPTKNTEKENSIEEIIEDYSRFTQKVLCYIIYNSRYYEIFYYKDISNNLNEYPIQIAKEVKQIPKIVMKWEYI